MQIRHKRPLMPRQLFKALVVERSHQLTVHRPPLTVLHRQRPFLLLSRSQAVAERRPRHPQFLVRQRTLHLSRMRVALAVLHPGKSQQQTIAVCLLISQFKVQELVASVNGPAPDHLIVGKHAVHDMHIPVRRAHLDSDRRPVVGKLCGRLPEPVVRLRGRALILEREDHKAALDSISLANSLQLMLPAD